MTSPSAADTPAVRASDTEREGHAQLLAAHAAAGRLTDEELSERLDSAYAARTRGELAAVLHDLPVAEVPADRPGRRARQRAELRGHLRSFVLVNLLLVAIWAATGAGYFWPIWPLLGWGMGIASHASSAFGGRTGFGMGCGGGRRARATNHA